MAFCRTGLPHANGLSAYNLNSRAAVSLGVVRVPPYGHHSLYNSWRVTYDKQRYPAYGSLSNGTILAGAMLFHAPRRHSPRRRSHLTRIM